MIPKELGRYITEDTLTASNGFLNYIIDSSKGNLLIRSGDSVVLDKENKRKLLYHNMKTSLDNNGTRYSESTIISTFKMYDSFIETVVGNINNWVCDLPIFSLEFNNCKKTYCVLTEKFETYDSLIKFITTADKFLAIYTLHYEEMQNLYFLKFSIFNNIKWENGEN